MTLKEKAWKKHDYEILFKDSSEYFLVTNAKMVQEGAMLRFVLFAGEKGETYVGDYYYPIQNIYRVQRKEGDVTV
jgi:hypothetical protein